MEPRLGGSSSCGKSSATPWHLRRNLRMAQASIRRGGQNIFLDKLLLFYAVAEGTMILEAPVIETVGHDGL